MMRMSMFLVASLMSCSVSAGEDAEPVRNPFISPMNATEGTIASKGEKANPNRPIDLRATLVAADWSAVNVAGVILTIGEEIQGYQLLDVGEGEAVFLRQGREIRVLLVEAPGKGISESDRREY